MTRRQARTVEHGVKEWAKQQLDGRLPYKMACEAAGLRPEDPAVGQAYRELRREKTP